MKRNLILLFVLFSISLLMNSAYSAEVNFEQVKIADGALLKATFTQNRFVKGFTRPIVSKGEMILLGNRGILWIIKSPSPNQYLIKHQGLYQVGDKKLNKIMKADSNVMMSLVSGILDGSFLNGIETFDVTVLSASNAKQWKVELTPKTKKIRAVIHNITIEGRKYIQSIIIQRLNGDKDIITIENHAIYVGKGIDKNLSDDQKRLLNG